MATSGPAAGVPNVAGNAQQVPLNQERSPVIMNVANFLRAHPTLKMRTGLMNNKEDVDFFRFKRLQRAILSEEYKKKSADGRNQMLPIPNEQELAKIFILFIQARLLVPVEKLHYAQVKEIKGWKPDRQKPTLRPTGKATMDPDQYYAWVYQKPNPYMMLYGFLMVAGIFTVVLFPLWPRFMRVGVWYLSMGCLGLLGLFFAMAFVRLIIFIVTYLALPQAFWLYPNLFEDCGFFESFQPLYAWSEDTKKGKKKKSKKAAVESETIPAGEKATGVDTGAARKRTVTLEEVEDK